MGTANALLSFLHTNFFLILPFMPYTTITFTTSYIKWTYTIWDLIGSYKCYIPEYFDIPIQILLQISCL